jgi:hypothetical protein
LRRGRRIRYRAALRADSRSRPCEETMTAYKWRKRRSNAKAAQKRKKAKASAAAKTKRR